MIGRTLAVVAVGWVMAACAAAEQPFFEKADIFEAGQADYKLFRIPGMVVTTKGTLLAYCEARRSGGDWGEIDIVMRRSIDGGATWQPVRKIVTPPDNVQPNEVAAKQNLSKPGEVTVNNPAAIVDHQTGAIHFLYCIEYARCYYMRSDDDGTTFTEPVDITATFDGFRPEYDWKVLATGPGHGIQLKSGRLLVPVWLSTGTGGHAHRPSAVATIYSDDHGKTWRHGQFVVKHPTPANPSETMAVQLADGRVMVNIRHESQPRFRAVSISPDGATNWSAARFDEQLPEPVCMGAIARYPAGAGASSYSLLFTNPHNPTGRERRNVSVKLSEDDGTTWPIMRTIEAGPSGYSDLAVGPDGTIYCFYERGRVDGTASTGALCVARFNMAWVKGGQGGESDGR